MGLTNELDGVVRRTQTEIEALEGEMDAIRAEIARRRQVQTDALRLYRSTTGTSHPLAAESAGERRESPRADQVLAVMEQADRPVTLAQLVEAMPGVKRGAISAVVHRAIKRGDVRRLERGVYELVGRYAQAS